MTRLDWFIMESFCYPLFIQIIIADIQRVNDRISYLEKHKDIPANAMALEKIFGG